MRRLLGFLLFLAALALPPSSWGAYSGPTAPVGSTAVLGLYAEQPGAIIEVISPSAPPVAYIGSASPCPFADGGYCFGARGGGSWVMAPQTIYDYRWWGLSTTPTAGCAAAAITTCLNFYADIINGNDYGGVSFCVLSTLPCKTIAQVLARAFQFCAAHGIIQVNLATGLYDRAQVSGQPTCGGGQGPGGGGLPVYIIGAGSGNTTLTDMSCPGNCQLDVVELSQGASLELQGLMVVCPSDDDCLFGAGSGDTLIAGSDVIIRGEAGGLSAIYMEGPNRFLQARTNTITIEGQLQNIVSLTYGANATIAGTVTCGSVNFTSGRLLTASYASTYYLNGSTFSSCPSTVAPYGLDNDFVAFIGSSTLPTGGNLPILEGKSSTDQPYSPCIGGAVGCPNTTAPTGFGAITFSGSTAPVVSSNSTVWAGQVQITAGSGAGSSGTVWLNFPVLLQTVVHSMVQCNANIGLAIGGGGTPFPVGSTAWVALENQSSGTNIEINSQSNGTPLTVSDVYSLNWICGD